MSRLLPVLVLLSCAGGPPPTAGPVLFIGNSLTYVNDLPGMVSALADSAGGQPVSVETVAFPNFSLGDHLADGSALQMIRRGGWEYVVLQQGPSSLDESRADLIASTRTLDAEIRKVGAKTALYGVWPEKARFSVFDRVSESYRLAAAQVHGSYFPGGEAWRAAWRRDSTLALYGPDDFHPSVLGTYLVALVVWQRITGRSPIGLPARLRTRMGTLVEIPPDLAHLLQDAAAEANAANPARP